MRGVLQRLPDMASPLWGTEGIDFCSEIEGCRRTEGGYMLRSTKNLTINNDYPHKQNLSKQPFITPLYEHGYNKNLRQQEDTKDK